MIVHVVMPDGVDDPARASGGNSYDRRVCDGLAVLGWTVGEHTVQGNWPEPDDAARAALARVLAELPDAAVVLLDGLIASCVPDMLATQNGRLRLVVLMHMPLLDARERGALGAATAVIATSQWSRRALLAQHELPSAAVHVAEPGVDLVPLEADPPDETALLCVAAVTPTKGHDVLVAALASIADLRWRCTCVGALDRDPGFVTQLRQMVHDAGLGDRLRFTGPLGGTDLDRAYAAAGVLLLASRAESYGMVVTESLARAIPVIATEVGGVPDTLGRGADGGRPGLLVRPGDPPAFAAALRQWLTDGTLRAGLRRAARERRATLPGWPVTVEQVACVLADVTRSG